MQVILVEAIREGDAWSCATRIYWDSIKSSCGCCGFDDTHGAVSNYTGGGSVGETQVEVEVHVPQGETLGPGIDGRPRQSTSVLSPT